MTASRCTKAARSANISTRPFPIRRCVRTHPTSAPRCATGSGTSTRLIGNLIIFNWRHHLQKTASQWTDAELAEKLKNIPSKERQEAWLRVARKPYTEEERDAARAKLVTQLLDKMEEALKPSGWLVGKAYSIADIAAVPFVKRHRRGDRA